MAEIDRTAVATHVDHITVCICTFKRPELLTRLLERLNTQRTEGSFTFSIVVADNDSERSAEHAVKNFCRENESQVLYCVEPKQNIAMVRNLAVRNATADLIAFIDDDELPGDEWLLVLFRAYKAGGVDGVLGPVKPRFEFEPPQWILKGRFFERPNHESGYQMTWAQCRTGNVLFRKRILDGMAEPFRPQFESAGEDMDFFRRLIDKGCKFIWCADAIVYELVPSSRCTRSFLLKRALLRGSNFPKHPADRLRNITRSIIAVPSYALALPILAILGHHMFLKYLVKLCDHTSRLLAFAGWSVVKERET